VGRKAVFILFYHASYQPQFFPAQEDDEASRKREYLAIAEDWVGEEAMDQLGLAAKARKAGRLYLDATVTLVRT
jgi:hypothetical protein